jgi:hypothetical protein
MFEFRNIKNVESLLLNGANPDRNLYSARTIFINLIYGNNTDLLMKKCVCFGANVNVMTDYRKNKSIYEHYQEEYGNDNSLVELMKESSRLESRFLRLLRLNTPSVVTKLLQLGAITPDSTVSRAKEVASKNETHAEEMQRLEVLACGGWSRSSHYLYSQPIKDAIWTTLLVANRFENEAELVDEPELEILPDELWKVIFSFLSRSDWL